MIELTPQQMAKKAVLMRARNEASIVRAYILNKVLPQIEIEFDRRLSTGEELDLQIPTGEELGRQFVDQFFAQNRLS